MKTFTAIDFETAQGYRWSICQVGLVRVVNGKITEKVSQLVKPPDNYYWDKFTNEVHGISAKTTKNAPTFDKVWPAIEKYIKNQTVVAHNAVFDCGCLEQTLEYYGLPVPDYQSYCTYRIYGSNLRDLCKEHSIDLNHHDALSDAMACAKLFLMHSGVKKIS